MPDGRVDHKVTYPGREAADALPAEVRTEEELNQAGRVALITAALKDDIERLGGRWTSSQVRENEMPPSAAVHFILEGKRYVAILQPLDMLDRAGR
jgi:hypothetical protein